MKFQENQFSFLLLCFFLNFFIYLLLHYNSESFFRGSKKTQEPGFFQITSIVLRITFQECNVPECTIKNFKKFEKVKIEFNFFSQRKLFIILSTFFSFNCFPSFFRRHSHIQLIRFTNKKLSFLFHLFDGFISFLNIV